MRRLWALVAMVGCAASPNTETLRQTSYDTDIDVVFDNVAAVTLSKYRTEANRDSRTIKTAWTQVAVDAGAMNESAAPVSRRHRTTGSERYFVRFDIAFVGPRPWAVRIRGLGARWRTGDARPTQLVGSEEPAFVALRTNALARAIHEQLAPYATRTPAQQ